ncbi:serum response factor isoform X3 [Rana temporaria]|uniref:serum response factor isoform X3 n=1 Tax=Rana temporaria TaxID=8407 RepID=UPI001AAD8A3C|nr:serum response factor isoform X3 [Rana temporaria]
MLPTQAGSSPGNGVGRNSGLSLSRNRPGNGSSPGRGSRPRYEVSPGVGSAMYSGSEVTSDSADEDETPSRGTKRGQAELELPDPVGPGGAGVAMSGGYPGVSGVVSGAKPGKKTRGRVKIKMEFIDNKLRRYTTFSKRKTGIMKKAYELSTLTGTQVLLLVASETGHVYTFATRKLQPMITSETGKALIQTCLNSPDSPPRSDPSTDQRMSATGFEETDLTYQVSESDSSGETKDSLKPAFTISNLPGTSTIQTAPTTSTSMQVTSGHSFPITNYLAPVTSANGTVLKTEGNTISSGGLMQLPSGFTLMSAGGAVAQQVPVQAIQVHSATQASPSSDSSSDLVQTSASGTVTLPAAIMTSSVPTTVSGHMMYPSSHAVMYAPTQGLTDGSLAVLNAFSSPQMQVSHSQEQGGVQQVFLTAPPGTVQIPVSAVQLHQEGRPYRNTETSQNYFTMAVIGQQTGSSSNLTELQVVNLDTSHNSKND